MSFNYALEGQEDMFEKAGKVIIKSLNKKGLDKVISSARICYEAEKVFAEALPKLKSRINIESFDQGVLKVSSVSGAINQEVQFKKDQILKKINHKLKNEEVKDLRFSVKA